MKRRILTDFAFHAHLPAVGLNNQFTDRKPQSSSFLFYSFCRGDLFVTLEELWNFLCRNSDSGIGDAHFDKRLILEIRSRRF